MADEKYVEVSLTQNLRDDLIFDLFATEENKKDMLSLREEHLRRKFKRFWCKVFCIRAMAPESTPATLEKLGDECGETHYNFVVELNNAGYVTLAAKLNLRPELIFDRINITKGDLS